MRPGHAISLLGGLLLLAGCAGKARDTGTTPAEPQWYATCGDPACSSYSGPFPGVPLCADVSVAIGDSCTQDEVGDECDPVDDCNARVRCATSDPTQQTGGCPISRARHKRDIVYLDPAARAVAADRAMSLPIDPAGLAQESADLYGLTSLTVAAIQEQEARLAELRARLDALERERGGE